MRIQSAAIRLVAGLALALALAAAIAPFAAQRASAQADNGEASITIYTAICPTDYAGTDFFGDCYNNPGADIDFLLSGPAFPDTVVATTGADGRTFFEGIDVAGEYLLQPDVPGEFTDFVARCSDEAGADFPLGDASDVGGVTLDLTLDDDLRCDFYIIPLSGNGGEAASITIYKAFCPAGYTGDNFFEDCYDNPGADITFTLTNHDTDESVDATTGADGFVAFEGITLDGTYQLEESIPGDFNDIFVLCSAGGEDFPVEIQDGGFVVFDLTTADDLRCDWYNIGVDQGVPTATVAPTSAATQAPQATSTVATLPNTGSGSGGAGGQFWPLAAVLALLGLGAVGFAAGRGRFAGTDRR